MKKAALLMFGFCFSVSIFGQPVQGADYTNSIGMIFKNIPPGSFYMGSCKLSADEKEANRKVTLIEQPPKDNVNCPSNAKPDNDARDDETPQHKVQISRAFQISIYEVTVGEFKAFIAGSGRYDLLTDDFTDSNSHGDNAAVSYVSWDDAQAFIRWLNEKEEGNAYRLPTEAEWEYAARAGTTTKYSWGNGLNQAGDYAWYGINDYYADSEKHPYNVGVKNPNPWGLYVWGLYDMHGNVWEWVEDWYDENYYQNSPPTDPKGASSGWYRVIRGGSWVSDARSLRSANRYANLPDNRSNYLGFRLVRQ